MALCVVSVCWGGFEEHIKRDMGVKKGQQAIKNIDFIYLINLDQRPEKLEKCLEQCKAYGVVPHRFSAVYGWDLSAEEINDLGVVFSPEMEADQWILHYPISAQGMPEMDFLRDECEGKVVFSRWMSPGAIGCALSHLSILQDAYEAGYETIWVMEDDIAIESDPKLLGDVIDRLDAQLGKEGWDILYTDSDKGDEALYIETNDFESNLKGDLYFFWRPDVDLSNRKRFAKRTVVNEEFIQIGSRMRTHSMIIRRSGIKKILDYTKNRHIFLPYDHEIATVPGIKLVNLRYNHVTFAASPSDIQVHAFSKKSSWEKYKEETLQELPEIIGWNVPVKAEQIMEFIRKNKPEVCVEIGAFGGSITYPISRALSFLKKGKLYAIDAWDRYAAVEGLEPGKLFSWWLHLDMEMIYGKFQDLITTKKLKDYCEPMRKTSQEAVSSFTDGSIDFLYLDGNISRQGSLDDAVLYFPKVKPGGYIWLSDADALNKNLAVAFLMKNSHWMKDKSIGTHCLLFQKKNPE